MRLHFAFVLSLATALPPAVGRAEVILIASNGQAVIGERIASEDEKSYEVAIYRDYTRRVPRAAVKERRDVKRPERAAREAFERRLKELGAAAAPAPKRSVSASEAAFLRQQIGRFFASAEERTQAVNDLKGRDTLPLAAVPEWSAACFAAARTGLQVRVGDTVFKHPDFEGNLHIEQWRKPSPGGAPAPAAPAADERWPVLISLHGGGLNDGNWRSGGPALFGQFRVHFDRMILVAPTVLQKQYAEWAGNPVEENYVREVFKAVKRTWKIDTDRVFIGGTSMGGYGAWQIGGHQADLFAGLVSGAGGILIGAREGMPWGMGVIGNLMHTPIAFVHGGKDEAAPPWSDVEADKILTALAARDSGCFRHKYLFYPEAGHNVPNDGMVQAVNWLASFIREPYPKRILWEPRRPINTQFYWLKMDPPQPFARLEGEIESNTVRLKTENIAGGFSVLLNDRLVDLSRPVRVEIDGRKAFEGPVQPSLTTILQTVDDRVDDAQWFSAQIDF